MWILITCLALGDLVVLALWLRERRRHRKSRNALRWWRERSGLTQIALDSDGRNLTKQLHELRRRDHRDTQRIHLAGTGGAA